METPYFSLMEDKKLLWVEVPNLCAQDPHQLQVFKWCETRLNREILEQHFTFSLPVP